MDQKTLGYHGEALAAKFLKKKGYKILERNFKSSRYGEIDIIAQDKQQLVFVEVKSKTSDDYGLPEEQLTYFKKKHLHRAIQDYFWRKAIEIDDWRLDLLAVDFSEDIAKPEIRHYQGVDLD